MISFFVDENGSDIRVVGFGVSLAPLSCAINLDDLFVVDSPDGDVNLIYQFSVSAHSVVVGKTRLSYPEEKLVFDPAIDALLGDDAVTTLLLGSGIRDKVAVACLNLGVRLDADPVLVEYAALHVEPNDFSKLWSAIVWFSARGFPVPKSISTEFERYEESYP